jgi:hypothetical protein
MTALLLAVIPIVLTALFAGHVAVSRTGRLRKDILANLDLLGRLPAEHPNRAVLEAKNRELVGVLARRQQRRYGPFTQAGFSLGAYAGVAAVSLAFAFFGVLLAIGVIPSTSASDAPDPGDGWAGAVFFLVIAAAAPWPRAGPSAGSSESTWSRRSSRPRPARPRGSMTAIEDRHARFLTSIRPRLDQLAPLMVSEHGRGFWAVLDPPADGVDSRVGFLPEGPGLAALESPELAELLAELLTRYDPAWRPPTPDLPGPFDPARDHLLVIYEGGAAYLYRLDGHPSQTRPLLTVVSR